MRTVVFTIAIAAVISSWYCLTPNRLDGFVEPTEAAHPVERYPLLLAEEMEAAPIVIEEELPEATFDDEVRDFPAPWPPKSKAVAAAPAPTPLPDGPVTLTIVPETPVRPATISGTPPALPAVDSPFLGVEIGLQDPLLGRFGKSTFIGTPSKGTILRTTALGIWVGGVVPPADTPGRFDETGE